MIVLSQIFNQCSVTKNNMASPVSASITLALALVSVLSGVVDARTFTVTNSCPYTIWSVSKIWTRYHLPMLITCIILKACCMIHSISIDLCNV